MNDSHPSQDSSKNNEPEDDGFVDYSGQSKKLIIGIDSVMNEHGIHFETDEITEEMRKEIIESAYASKPGKRAFKPRNMNLHRPNYSDPPPLPFAPFNNSGPQRAFGYGRVSMASQYEKDNSIPSQKFRIELYYKAHLEVNGVEWCGFREDGKAVSARHVSFFARPAGRVLMNELRQGDHIIFDKVDRVWRDTKDFCIISDWFKRNGITMHIINFGGGSFQTGTAITDFFLTMLVAVAKLEAETTSARTKEAYHRRKSAGLIKPPKKGGNAGSPPLGCKIVKSGKLRRIVWDHEERKYMAIIFKMRETLLMDFADIAYELERRRCHATGEFFREGCMTRGRLARSSAMYNLHQRYCTELAYRILGVKDTSNIPPREVMMAVSRSRAAEVAKLVREAKVERKKAAELAKRNPEQ